MATTLTSGATTITPDAVFDYESEQDVQTIVHWVPGNAQPVIVYRPAGLRAGTLRLSFRSESASNTARTALASTLASWAAASSDVSSVNMTFAVVGKIRRTYDASVKRWTLEVGYQEVS